MTPVHAFQKNKPSWKLFFSGFLLGLLVSFLILVFIAFQWGPQGESVEVDLYSGHTLTHKHFLWKRTHTPGPMSDPVKWAIEHQDPQKSWYVFASSISRAEWFGPMVAVDSATQPFVHAIYSLQVPEAEKIQILQQYHQDLDVTQIKVQERMQPPDLLDSFYTKWQQRLEKLRNDPDVQS